MSRRLWPAPLWLSSILACALALVAATWFFVTGVIAEDRAATLDQLQAHHANLARVLKEHTVRTLNYVDGLSLLIKSQYEADARGFDLQALFDRAHVDRELIHAAVIADEADMVVAGTVGPSPRLYMGDREHFAVHHRTDGNRLYISKPVEARLAKRWSVVATRRLNKPDGSFGGVVGISIDPFYFTNFYRQVKLGDAGVVALIGDDGVIRARSVGDRADLGQNIRASELFRHLVDAPSGHYVALSAVDAVRRLFTYRTAAPYPLVVNIGIAESDALALFRARESRYLVGASVLTVLLLAAAAALMLVIQRHQRITAALAAARETAHVEQEVMRVNAELEERVKQRTDALAAVNRELESYSALVSHNLRGPARVVTTLSEMLLAEHGEGIAHEARDWAAKIAATGRRMGEMIDGMLALARIRRDDMHFERLDLSAIAQAVWGDLLQVEPGRQVDFSLEAGLEARGDIRLVRIALENLLGNAFKYTRRVESAKVEFRRASLDGAAAFVVADNGVGFDPAQAGNLFNLFTRLHPATQFEGHGVGLAAVRRIVEYHGGRVWAESAAGKGAAIYFTLAPAAA